MRKRILTIGALVSTAILLVAAFTAYTFVSAPSTHAAAHPLGRMHTLTETIHVSAADCAQRKADFPQRASDPSICTITHTAQWSDPVLTQTKGVSPDIIGCLSGDQYYWDQLYDPLYYDMRQIETFFWDGSCNLPTDRGTHQCETVGPFLGIIQSSTCSTVYPGGNYPGGSTADKYEILWLPAYFPFVTADTWEQRVCTSESFSCAWQSN